MIPPYTLRLMLRTDKANAKNLCPIVLWFSTGGKRTMISTGRRVLEKQWHNERVKGHPNAALYNAELQTLYDETEAKILKGESVNSKGNSGDFHAYAAKYIATANIAYETRRRNQFDLAHIRNFAPKLRWSEITPVWLHRFNTYLCSPKKKLDRKGKQILVSGMDQNSAVKPLSCMRKIFNEALKDGTISYYPFGRGAYIIPAERKKTKEYLTMEELDSLEALLNDDHWPVITRSTIAHFLLECYSGIRHGDWSTWQTERLVNDESLKLTTKKTSQPIYLPLKNSPRLKAIIELIRRDKLSYSYSNQDANRRLKLIAAAANIKKNLTSHVGRHTAATMLLERGFSRETVAEVLGVSMKVIDIYAKMTRQKVKGEFERLGGL